MASHYLELSLSLKPTYHVPKTIANLLLDLSKIDDPSCKLSVLSDYIHKHEEELSRLQALGLEFPQCTVLLTDAIETLKEEFVNTKSRLESSSGQPLKELLPTKRQIDEEKKCNPNHAKKQKAVLETIQPYKDKNIEESFTPIEEVGSNFHKAAAEKETSCSKESFICSALGDAIPRAEGEPSGQGGLNIRARYRNLINYHPKPLTQPIWKNNRRAWSPELHARFLDSLNLLGGIEVATPKQIKEVMQVEGLTNDQVKSHLQKHRLHYSKVVEIYRERLAKSKDAKAS